MNSVRVKSRWVWAILIGLFVVPMVLAFVMVKYRVMWWGRVNHGLLLPTPVTLDVVSIRDQMGHPLAWGEQWSMMVVTNQTCGAVCQKNLYTIHQVQIALNKNRNKVRRLLLFVQPHALVLHPRLTLSHRYPKLLMLRVSRSVWQHELLFKMPKKLAFQSANLYLIDPRGQIVLVYKGEVDGEALLHDIKRIL